MTDAIQKDVTIGGCRLILGDALAVMPDLDPVDHLFSDPPYEQSLHDAKNGIEKRKLRTDGGVRLRALDFAGIDEIRAEFTELSVNICGKWFIVFCTIEGVARWADVINPSAMKYKRGCIWVKPDSTPQLNGQGPAQGAECFVTAWCGSGHAKWNGGGKRGVYTHLTNPPDRHGGHPTEKPWRLMRDIVLDFTNPGETILDPFMGSGTTLVAAALTGRRAVGVEKNPEYFAIAEHRVRKAMASSHALGPQLSAEIQEALL
ncbi:MULTISPECIES: site-specific DNA-methyltransferase [Phaeobacter]|uniref:DNA-methyltransferase n=1 Tax=Phaeobacter TaxID=302485 RepID=UPI0006938F74|nr:MULTISPECIES: site-specific DNA-methyltransferase [Phaeobacter]AUQ89378.1 modification methylase BabI [Phaeobacter inhibens]